MSSGAAGTMRIWIAPTNTCEFNAGEVLWKDEVPIPAGEGWTNAEIQVTQVGVIENPPLYVNISNWTSGDSLCIDMMKWVPDGGDEPIEPGDEDVPFPAGSVTVSGYAGKYDGAEHGISVKSEIAGFAAKYCTEQFGEFTTEAPTLSDVGSLTVWCEMSAPGYITETNSATVAISRREVSLTSGSDSKAYDGSPLQCADIHVGGDGFATGEGAGFNVTGSQTDVGESENAFTYMLNEGTKADNYAIATSNGTLTVTKASVGPGGGEEPGGGAVPTGGESKFDKACDYDGEGHAIDTNALVAAFGAAMVGGATVEYAVDDGSGASGGVGHAALPWVNEPSVYTNAGEYIVWYRVTNPNYEYFEHAAKVTVKTAENTWISEPSIAGWTSGQAASEPDMGVAKFGVASVTYGETGTTPPVDAGDYTAVFTVPATENYTGLAKSVPFTVAPEPPVIHIPGEGKVVVPKTWKTGQKVTWKATAAKGSVFAHWEGPFVDKLELSRNELRNPSLQFSMPAEFNTNWISAVFIAVDDDRLGNLTLSQPGPFAPNEDVDGLRVVDDSESYVTASVSGLPAGLKFNAKTLAITGKPTKSGVYWAQIKAKNASGYQWAENVKMTVSGEGPEANEPRLTRTAYYPLTVICATEGGTVVGTGVYADGKKVSVTAKSARGWAFAGWYLDAGLAEPAAFATGDMRSTSQSVMVPEVRYLFARFVVESDDVDSLKVAVGDAWTDPDGTFSLDLGACVESLSLPKLAVTGLPAGLKYDAKTLRISGKATKPGVYTVKVAATNASVKKATDAPSTSFKITVPNFECDAMPNLKSATDAYGIVFAGVVFSPGRIDCTPKNGWSVRVAGLPTGLKYDAKTGKISGVPTAKAGSYTVTFTASKKGEANQVATITLNVESLPAWAVGTFDGAIEDGALDDELGTALLTVAANGKISGKILEGGRTWTLSAASFDSVDDPKSETESQVFIATVVGKIGKEIVSNDVKLAAASVDGVDVGVASGSAERRDGAAVALYRWATCQNLWKRVDTNADMPVFKANIVKTVELAEPGDTDNALKLTFKANGVVVFSGKVGGVNASGSSQLVPVLPDEGVAAPYQVTLYAPPKGASAGLHETYFVELELEGAIVKDIIFK